MTDIDALVEQARLQLARGDRACASALLSAALDLQPACLSAHNLREEHGLAGNYTESFGVNALISPDDDVYRFFAGHPDSRNPPRDYLADGWRTLCELQQVLDRFGRSIYRCTSFLEFAAGHGRLTRHLAKAMPPPGALTVSDVVPGSVAFLRQRFGVKGFDSAVRPEDLRPPQSYDVVFALSLFSHLPESTWHAWLSRLFEATAPGGILIFTTHGERAARASGVDWGSSGFAFFVSSESRVLASAEYGTTFTSAPFVERAIAKAEPGAAVTHVPSAFWNYQDAWVLMRP